MATKKAVRKKGQKEKNNHTCMNPNIKMPSLKDKLLGGAKEKEEIPKVGALGTVEIKEEAKVKEKGRRKKTKKGK